MSGKIRCFFKAGFKKKAIFQQDAKKTKINEKRFDKSD
jgi:hypothetical protein